MCIYIYFFFISAVPLIKSQWFDNIPPLMSDFSSMFLQMDPAMHLGKPGSAADNTSDIPRLITQKNLPEKLP